MAAYDVNSHSKIDLILFRNQENLNDYLKVHKSIHVAKLRNVLGESEIYQSERDELFIPVFAPAAYKR
jgi:hypothetical protein